MNEAGESSKESLIINRDDFWVTTSNKQINFLQHIFTILRLLPQSGGGEPDAEGFNTRRTPGGGRRVVGPCLANFYWMKFLTRRLNFSGFSMNMK